MADTEFAPHTIPDGIVMIRPQNLLEDKTVGKVMGFAAELSHQITRFKVNGAKTSCFHKSMT